MSVSRPDVVPLKPVLERRRRNTELARCLARGYDGHLKRGHVSTHRHASLRESGTETVRTPEYAVRGRHDPATSSGYGSRSGPLTRVGENISTGHRRASGPPPPSSGLSAADLSGPAAQAHAGHHRDGTVPDSRHGWRWSGRGRRRWEERRRAQAVSDAWVAFSFFASRASMAFADAPYLRRGVVCPRYVTRFSDDGLAARSPPLRPLGRRPAARSATWHGTPLDRWLRPWRGALPAGDSSRTHP
jgi:hypothetical protein